MNAAMCPALLAFVVSVGIWLGKRQAKASQTPTSRRFQ